MASDLISRSALIKALNDYVQQVYDCDGIDDGSVVEYQQLHEEDKTSYIIQGFCEAFEILQEQPTAYNVDAVVEELAKIKGYYGYYGSEECEYVPYETTVGVVRKGGVNE